MSQIKVLYVLGTSFSGSSLLGFVLGSIPPVWNLGEVKVFPREHKLNRICTCKESTLDCPYWGPLYDQNLTVFNRGTRTQRWKAIWDILLHRPVRAKANYGDRDMLKASLDHARSFEPRTEWLVDTSKSIWRLMALKSQEGIDVKVIYLRRGAKENIASFVKHGHAFFSALQQYGIFHGLAKRWLTRMGKEGQDFLTIQHEDLALKEQATMDKLGIFLGLNYSEYRSKMSQREYHIRTGNPRTVDQFREGFKGFFYDEHWKSVLSQSQQNWIDRIF